MIQRFSYQRNFTRFLSSFFKRELLFLKCSGCNRSTSGIEQSQATFVKNPGKILPGVNFLFIDSLFVLSYDQKQVPSYHFHQILIQLITIKQSMEAPNKSQLQLRISQFSLQHFERFHLLFIRTNLSKKSMNQAIFTVLITN